MPKTLTIRPTFVLTSDRLPTEQGRYLCIVSYGDIITLPFNIKHKMFNVSDDDASTAITPVAWAKMPATVCPFAKEQEDV